MTIVTKRGDRGQTDLAGQVRTSKASLRVECYGTLDELISQLGFVRSICAHVPTQTLVKDIQRVLFRVGSGVATDPNAAVEAPEISTQFVESLDEHIRQIESTGTIASDWSIPGEDAAGAAMDLARTVCRRAERQVVRLAASGESVDPNVLVYLNRLSDLLWLLARQLESSAGVDSRLRDADHPGKPWSSAW